jgi:hypothetical protein
MISVRQLRLVSVLVPKVLGDANDDVSAETTPVNAWPQRGKER